MCWVDEPQMGCRRIDAPGVKLLGPDLKAFGGIAGLAEPAANDAGLVAVVDHEPLC